MEFNALIPEFAVADPDGYLLRFACALDSREKTS